MILEATVDTTVETPDLITRYLKDKSLGVNHTGRPASKNTLTNYRSQLRKIEQITHKPIEEVTGEDLVGVIEDQREKGISNETMNMMITAARGFYTWADKNHVGTKASMDDMDGIHLRSSKPKEPRYINEATFRAIIRAIEQEDEEKVARAMQTERGGNLEWTKDESRTLKKTLPLKLMFYGGARINEACTLQIDNILDDAVIFVGKGNRERFVPLPKWLLKELSDYAAEFGEDPWVFVPSNKRPGNENRPIQTTYLHIEFRKAVQKLGLPEWVKPHVLRHSFAKRLMEATNGRIDVVQDLLGHDDPKTTRIYAKNSREDIINQVRDLWS